MGLPRRADDPNIRPVAEQNAPTIAQVAKSGGFDVVVATASSFGVVTGSFATRMTPRCTSAANGRGSG